MKKAGNIIFWVVISILVFFIVYTFYHRFYPNSQLVKMVPDQNGRSAQETTLGSTSSKNGSGRQVRQNENPMAPDFTLPDINGKEVKLSDLRGKIVILNFWATWCPYCVREMPDLDELSSELAKKGNAVVLAVDEQEDIRTVTKFIKEKKIRLNVLMDNAGSVGEEYGASSGIPLTYIIDQNGRVYGYVPGATNKNTLAGIVNEILKK